MIWAVDVILRCRSEAEASKGGGVPSRWRLGRTSFEARKGSHLRMTGLQDDE
jgi:hypothetical protein